MILYHKRMGKKERSISFKDGSLLGGFLNDVTGFHQIHFHWYLQQLVGRDSLQPYSYKSHKALLNIQPLQIVNLITTKGLSTST